MPIGAAPVLPRLDDYWVVREARAARGVAQHFDELRSSQGQPAEGSRKQSHKDHLLLARLSEVEDQPDHAPKNVGPAIAARRCEPKAAVVLEEGQVGQQHRPSKEDNHAPHRHADKQRGARAPGAVKVEVQRHTRQGAEDPAQVRAVLAEERRPIRQQISWREFGRTGGGIEQGGIALGMHQGGDHGVLPARGREQLLEAETHAGADHAESDQVAKFA